MLNEKLSPGFADKIPVIIEGIPAERRVALVEIAMISCRVFCLNLVK